MALLMALWLALFALSVSAEGSVDGYGLFLSISCRLGARLG